VAVLPLAAEDYETDFRAAASREEFRSLLHRADEMTEIGPATSRDAAGRHFLDRADILVTVWDGHGVQGHDGTAAVVTQARERGLPLAWVHTGKPQARHQRADLTR
jgi:hypothetical protein